MPSTDNLQTEAPRDPTRPPGSANSAEDRRPQVIAITSGKGGVGKSSIAINLGLCLSMRGRKVCILDADTGLANAGLLLGMRPEYSLEHVLSGEHSIEAVIQKGPHGLKLVPGANGIAECVDLDTPQRRHLANELARIEGEFDYLLLDTAAGISNTTLAFIGAAHRMLLILTPEPTSLTDAYSLLRLALRRGDVNCQVLVNMVGDVHEARDVFQRFSGAVEKYLKARVNFLSFIQRDESLRNAVLLQYPVALFPEHDPSHRTFQRMADALENAPPVTAPGRLFSQCWLDTKAPDDTGAAPEEPDEASPAESPPPPSPRSEALFSRDNTFTVGDHGLDLPARHHGYDEARFGPQQQLADQLRQLGHQGLSLMERLRRLQKTP
ncbi:MinD/ParA family protein [Ectothiorhodospira lacustris]|uniref:MinD/ParA family protein n=1 Tax=Ectothiorhodospira lacustris TaxID=2899127 RepID=UPI001EE9663E|nr:MinD/ParA family protein [Ectothiorhodospira lacustris]MCG5502036.1 MinD/ParA family protein [Ectothiorhodospira lacustris]MCG5509516.1 MinD/ParA family protein [Ectothiorhodospira lacustris]MCG5521689.1 MinD/ParA family protein [Ectothiorhodospira lacustris]